MDTDYGQYFGRFQIIFLQFYFVGENLYSFEVHISHPHTTMGFKEKSHQIDQVWQKLI